MDPYYATIILGLVQLFGCALSILLVKLVSRRLLLFCSMAACSMTMAALAFSVHLQWPWVSLVSLLTFTFSFMTGLSPIPWILVAQLAPTGIFLIAWAKDQQKLMHFSILTTDSKMKGIVAGLSTAFCYLFIFLSALTFPFMNGWQLWHGPFGTFLFYAVVALVGSLYVAFWAPLGEPFCTCPQR